MDKIDHSFLNNVSKHLEKDYENWVLYTDSFRSLYDESFKPYDYKTKIFPYGEYSFILIREYNEEFTEYGTNIYLEFAYVPSEFRRKGILRKLFNMVFKHYKKTIFLASIGEDSHKVWGKLGFIEIPENNKFKRMVLDISKIDYLSI